MCGIIGMTSCKPVANRLLDGLQLLEYRGYDSSGIALFTENGLRRLRAEGKLSALRAAFERHPLEGNCGMGHTRWATHGIPSERNAHPQGNSRVMVVHNGIIENFLPLKKKLLDGGAVFESETDTEVLAHLVDAALQEHPDIQTANQLPALLLPLFQKLDGSFACALACERFPHLILCYRQGNSPLTIGYGEGEMFFGSDAIALSQLTDTLSYLEDGDLALLMPEGVSFFDAQQQATQRARVPNPIPPQSMSKSHHTHFMRKEMEEQPEILRHLLTRYLHVSQTSQLDLTPLISQPITDMRLVACGTAYYAGQVATSWLEAYARLSPHVDIASEFRYRRPPLAKDGTVILISQSGETVDTLGALTYAQAANQHTLAVVNVPSSSLERLADISLKTHAGPEIGVASTKSFTSQLMILAFLALDCGKRSGHLSPTALSTALAELQTVPDLISQTLALEPIFKTFANALKDASSALYLGRGTMAALACEGALKLKELSYIHAEGYPAGEMKHGPIALLDAQLPVIALAPSDTLFEKMAGNLQETAARGAPLLVITDAQGKERLQHLQASFLVLPAVTFLTAPFVYGLALHLLAYHTACLRGNDVDQPRNLAKSVTVE